MTSVLACPVCDAELTSRATDAACPNGHAFDRARSGYLNLLLSNRKQSKEPGDSPDMMRSRRTFLHGGFYDRMAEATNAAVIEIVAGRTDGSVADLGCGEGVFTACLPRALVAAAAPRGPCYGVDVSPPGLTIATASHRGATSGVARL